MAKVLIKRGLKADLPSLSIGELGFCTDTKELFIGTSTGNSLMSAAGGGGTAAWGNITGTLSSQTDLNTALSGKASTSTATSGANGLMSSTDKSKLDGIANGANNYIHPSNDGNLHVPETSTTNNGKFLKAGSTAGSMAWTNITATDITQDSSNRFVTDVEKAAWNASGSVGPHNIYVVELSRWGISNTGTNASATTTGINNALAWAYANKYTYVKLPSGTYLISKGANPTPVAGVMLHDYSVNACIRPPNDMVIDLYGCTLKKEPNGFEGYAVIKFEYSKNVTILGGTIEGDAFNGHDYTSSGIHEGCNGVVIGEGSRNIELYGMDIHSYSGYNVTLTSGGGQLYDSRIADWETGKINDTTGASEVNLGYMRMNKFITLASLKDQAAINAVPRRGTDLNGGVFYIQGNGYGSFGFKTDGYPFQLSRTAMEIYFYDDSDVFKGKIDRRTLDEINLRSVPTGSTKFKIAFRADITQIIASTFMLQISSINPSRGIKIANCKLHDGFALGIAVTGSQQILIENNEIYRIGNSTPTAGRKLYPFPMGIDIEDLANMNQNIIVKNNRFTELESLSISAVHTRNMLVENNVFDKAGVVFQGSRGTNLVSHNNVYHKCGGFGEGNPIFKNDTFIDATMELQYESTYQDCLFENFFHQFNYNTQANFVASTLYQTTDSVLPTTKNGFYYVLTAGVGTTVWVTGVSRLADSVVTNAGKAYKCTIKGAGNSTVAPTHSSGTSSLADGYSWQYLGATGVEPTWKTDLTDTTDVYGNMWKAWVYDPTYLPISFKGCRFNYTKVDTTNGVLIRRGSLEYDNCKFNANGSTLFFISNDATDYAGKNTMTLRDCDFYLPAKIGVLRGNKITMIRCNFVGQKGVVEQTNGATANELIVSGCTFTDFDVRFRGLPNSKSKSIHFTNNIINLGKTVRVFGASNEGVWISNFDNAFIENNKAIITASVVARPFTIYAEKYLKFTDNFIDSNHATQNKLELFGALRDATYTTAIMPTPKLTSVIKDNFTNQYPFQIDATYSQQLYKFIGDGTIDINSSTLGSLDRVSTVPTSGVYALGQIVYNSTPIAGGSIGWICISNGVANNQSRSNSTPYSLGARTNASGHVYEVTVAGTSSASAPTWTTTSGATVTDGTVTWKEIGLLAVFKEFGLISG